MPVSEFRFYEELNDFLPAERKKVSFEHDYAGSPSVKDVVESLGVPHPEIDLIVVDGVSVGFEHRLEGGERVAVYPVFESIDISAAVRLRPRPLRNPRFIIDENLGRLVRLLRLVGLDCLYDPGMDDRLIAETAARDGRTILTRDRGLLMRRIVSRGYFVRNDEPRRQAGEVVERFDLSDRLTPFTRCADCNGVIVPVEKGRVYDRLPEMTRDSYDEFHECEQCGKLYWRGSHWDELTTLVEQIRRNNFF